MLPATFLHCADAPLSRVDFSSLSDQMCMELLIEGFHGESKSRYQDTEGVFLDVCEWSCVECDSDERVVRIREVGDLYGSLQLPYVPPKVTSFALSSMKLDGSIDLTHLPEGIRVISLTANLLTGSVDLTHLPPNLEYLLLGNNQLRGSLDLIQLPQGMIYLSLENNHFTGSFIATNLPKHLMVIYANMNKFCAVAVVQTLQDTLIHLDKTGVTSVIDENGNENRRGVILSSETDLEWEYGFR